MQQCCESNTVHEIAGCEWCYYQDSTARNSKQFNEDFAVCLRRAARQRNVTAVSVHYCSTPDFSGGAVGVGMKSWFVVALVALSLALVGLA